MTSWPPSGSESGPRTGRRATPPGGPTGAYDLLHPRVQKWIYGRGWRRLRDAQEKAAPPILAGDTDVIVAAATASGKTEAAWLPICSALLAEADQDGRRPRGVRALYVSPLKALINDQHQRLDDLCTSLGLPVHPWHGDVAASHKSRALNDPDGILLITPESVEALFVNRGTQVAKLFGGLRYIVIDEMHSFLGTERGAQLQSLMHRIELAIRRRIPRVGLSATLGDFAAAADFLRPGSGGRVEIVQSAEAGTQISLQVKGYTFTAPNPAFGRSSKRGNQDTAAISARLFRTLRGTNNLIFANSRQDVETYTDLLNRLCAQAGVPQEFVPHHGGLSKELREQVESRLKASSTPVTAVCTSTLEMGVDIGAVASVAQVGAPPSVAALRQRLGRSGRRDGSNAVLRVYVSEPVLTGHTAPTDQLRTEIFQTCAVIEMLLGGRYELPQPGNLHLSTLIQQILSVVAQHGGVSAQQLHSALCGHGPFINVDLAMFAGLLRSMGQHELLMQDANGQLLPGTRGEELINHYGFFTAFHTRAEFRLVAGGETIGTMPVDPGIMVGSPLVFAGRRWKVLRVEDRQRIIELTAAGGGQAPKFLGGGGPEVTDAVRRAMRRLYLSEDVPRYLDNAAQQLFLEGRDAFHRQGHAESMIFAWGGETLIYPWRGDRIMTTLTALFTEQGLDVAATGPALTVQATAPDHLHDVIRRLAAMPQPDPVQLAGTSTDKRHDKYDGYLSQDLLDHAYAARSLDVPGTWELLLEIASSPAVSHYRQR
jgi:ATP-dependent Lhr-like helicase